MMGFVWRTKISSTATNLDLCLSELLGVSRLVPDDILSSSPWPGKSYFKVEAQRSY